MGWQRLDTEEGHLRRPSSRSAGSARRAGLLQGLTVTLAALALAACEYPGVTRDVEGELPPWFAGDAPRQAARAPAPAPAPAPPPAPSGGRGPGQALPVRTGPVEIVFVEYELKPDRLAVRPGTITFVLKNGGRFTHDFQVQGGGIDMKTPKFGPETTLRARVTLKEGEYKISCPLSNHAERGMVGTLIVKGP